MTNKTSRWAVALGLGLTVASTGAAHADETPAVTIAASPVQIGAAQGLGKDGQLVSLAFQIDGVAYAPSQCDAITCHTYRAVTTETSLLPYGSFLVAIDNHSDNALVVHPKDFTLTVGKTTAKAFASPGDVALRWERTVRYELGASTRPVIRPNETPIWAAEDDLAILPSTVTIAPHASRIGYVAFDVGAYSAAEYRKVLASAPELNVTLATPGAAATARVRATATVTVPTTST